MFNKELEAQIEKLIKENTDLRVKVYALEVAVNTLTFNSDTLTEKVQELLDKLAESVPQKPTDSPFLTKEGLFNYKHRKTPNE
jgi:hypothetical protein